MKLETFFEKFDQFADAPDAVAKMRELVLELAIQGKLVAQNGKDEPACRQLERIAAKKSKTGRVARVKAGAGASSAPEDTVTHVPDGWEKSTLAELVTVLNGRAYSKHELLDAGTPVLRVGNLFTSKHWYYSDLGLEPDKYCDKGDLIFAWSASFGPFIWPGPKVIYHYHIWKLELHSEADLHKGFLYWFLQNKTQEIKRAGHGVSMLHMTKEKMEKLEVMVPPLAEQKRIVAKVDELMALCDRLETQQQERETQHAALARASLARFADAPTPANLNFLFHPSYAIPPADLRKSILTLAVQGKLVPQDPNDEPAEEWLQVVATSTSDEVSEIGEPPFPLPDRWIWLRVASVFQVAGGIQKTPHRTPRNNAHPYLGVGNVYRGRLDLTNVKEFELEPGDLERRRLEAGDLLVIEGNGSFNEIGRCAKWNGEIENCVHQNHVIRCRPADSRISDFVLLFLNSPNGMEIMQRLAITSSGLYSLSVGKIRQIEIPVPPLAEQRRIVAKVKQLMALVDDLETQLAASRTTGTSLMQAVVAELTARA